MSEPDHETIGRAAFEAYSESTGGLTYDGKEIPSWEGLTEAIRLAWVAAGHAAVMSFKDW